MTNSKLFTTCDLILLPTRGHYVFGKPVVSGLENWCKNRCFDSGRTTVYYGMETHTIDTITVNFAK